MNLHGLNYDIQNFLYLFIAYSFLGWCLETTFCSINEKNFINRGFLFGPFCTMYGFGALAILKILKPVENNYMLLFIFSVIITSGIEYLTGLIMEKFFNTTWWDYSDVPFNIHGRICLSFSLAWGVVSIILMKVINPFVSSFINYAHTSIGSILLYGITLYMIIDLIFTLKSLKKLNSLLSQLNQLYLEAKEKFINKEFIKDKNESLEDIITELKKRYDCTYNKIQQKYSRYLKAFPEYTVDKIKVITTNIKEKISSFL